MLTIWIQTITIGLVVETSSGIYRLTVGKAIPLFDSNGQPLPKALVYDIENIDGICGEV